MSAWLGKAAGYNKLLKVALGIEGQNVLPYAVESVASSKDESLGCRKQRNLRRDVGNNPFSLGIRIDWTIICAHTSEP